MSQKNQQNKLPPGYDILEKMLPPEVAKTLEKYKDVEPSSVKPNPKVKQEEHLTEYKEDFSKASIDFYKNTEYNISYKTGYTIGQYGSQEQRFEVFMKRLKDGIKEILTDSLRENEETTEDLKQLFKIYDDVFDLLATSVSNKTKIDMKKILAKTHGFINGYVSHAKIKED